MTTPEESSLLLNKFISDLQIGDSEQIIYYREDILELFKYVEMLRSERSRIKEFIEHQIYMAENADAFYDYSQGWADGLKMVLKEIDGSA